MPAIDYRHFPQWGISLCRMRMEQWITFNFYDLWKGCLIIPSVTAGLSDYCGEFFAHVSGCTIYNAMKAWIYIMVESDKKKIIKVYSDKKVIDLYKNIGFWKIEKLISNRFIPRNASWKILDAGCGAGRTAIELARMGNLIYGIDISYDILRETQTIMNGNSTNIRLINSDLLNIPFKARR